MGRENKFNIEVMITSDILEEAQKRNLDITLFLVTLEHIEQINKDKE